MSPCDVTHHHLCRSCAVIKYLHKVRCTQNIILWHHLYDILHKFKLIVIAVPSGTSPGVVRCSRTSVTSSKHPPVFPPQRSPYSHGANANGNEISRKADADLQETGRGYLWPLGGLRDLLTICFLFGRIYTLVCVSSISQLLPVGYWLLLPMDNEYQANLWVSLAVSYWISAAGVTALEFANFCGVLETSGFVLFCFRNNI